MSATLSSLFLVCRDLAASSAFYSQLGFLKVRGSSRTAVFELGSGQGPELHLHADLTAAEMEEYQVGWQAGTRGLVLSFQVDDLDAALAQAPPEALLVSPRLAPWGVRLALLRDPDGYRLELSQRSGKP
jgi:catechol 2,3-dioxygenase-like lactoylglutathione lyase family enzyme